MSTSWLEWTQQLQAYIAWVNSQLRKRPDLRPVQDLRTDLQSGEVLAQLVEIICEDRTTPEREGERPGANFITHSFMCKLARASEEIYFKTVILWESDLC